MFPVLAGLLERPLENPRRLAFAGVAVAAADGLSRSDPRASHRSAAENSTNQVSGIAHTLARICRRAVVPPSSSWARAAIVWWSSLAGTVPGSSAPGAESIRPYASRQRSLVCHGHT